MAMGTKINDFIPFISENTGKLILTIFRVAAISGLGYWLLDSIKKQSGVLLCWALSLIFAGALGNVDSIFYGILFSDSNDQIAQFLPEQGYAPLFYGHVVDMLQFPLIEWTWPSWLPYIGGKDYLFFNIYLIYGHCNKHRGLEISFFNKKSFPDFSRKLFYSIGINTKIHLNIFRTYVNYFFYGIKKRKSDF